MGKVHCNINDIPRLRQDLVPIQQDHAMNDEYDQQDSALTESEPNTIVPGATHTLPKFKDYYSEDDIHTDEVVSVLWEHQPQLEDEFELERGQMIFVVGLWNDAWGTGIRTGLNAAEYSSLRDALFGAVMNWHRMSKDIGAFPERDVAQISLLTTEQMICVTLPQHWKAELEKQNGRTKIDISIQAPQEATAGLGETSIKTRNPTENARDVVMAEDYEAEDSHITRKESENLAKGSIPSTRR